MWRTIWRSIATARCFIIDADPHCNLAFQLLRRSGYKGEQALVDSLSDPTIPTPGTVTLEEVHPNSHNNQVLAVSTLYDYVATDRKVSDMNDFVHVQSTQDGVHMLLGSLRLPELDIQTNNAINNVRYTPGLIKLPRLFLEMCNNIKRHVANAFILVDFGSTWNAVSQNLLMSCNYYAPVYSPQTYYLESIALDKFINRWRTTHQSYLPPNWAVKLACSMIRYNAQLAAQIETQCVSDAAILLV